MPLRHITTALLAAGTAIALFGCGLTDPYGTRPSSASTTPTTSTSTTTTGDPARERGGTIPARVRAAQDAPAVGAGQPTPRAALEQFARVYVNWTAATVAANQRELAAISVGQARAQALQAAATYTRDQTLRQSGVTNTGVLVALTQSLTTPGRWVLVTSEQTTGNGDYTGLPPTLHVTYAQITHVLSGWIVSAWAPQN